MPGRLASEYKISSEEDIIYAVLCSDIDIICVKIYINVVMKRAIYPALQAWKRSSVRKPLIIKGARQVGKTYLLKEFGRRDYEATAYLNFDRDPDLAGLFLGKLDPREIVKKISIYLGMPVLPGRTLIILDEVQNVPAAIGSLKYFQEEAPEFHVAAAGSLLGLALNKPTAFPVGKVEFLDMFPMTFGEFLEAAGRSGLREMIEGKADFVPLDEVFHRQLVDLLKVYKYVGGMPEAVARYTAGGDLLEAREVQNQILAAHELDFRKHSGSNDAVRLAAVWDSIPAQLAGENKRFLYSAVETSARAAAFKGSLQWFVEAGLVLRCARVKAPRLPLAGYREETIAKAYFFDVGLLAARLGLSPKTILEGDRLFVEYHGALAENFAAQELTAAAGLGAHSGSGGFPPHRGLFYWASEGQAEVDFLVEAERGIFPLEIKAGVSRRKRSLRVYGEKYHPRALSRATQMNFRHDGDIWNLPLYAVSRFPMIVNLP